MSFITVIILFSPKTLSEGRDAARVYKRASDDPKAAVPEILAKATRTESASSTVVSASNIVTEFNTAPKPGISLTFNFH